MKEGSFRNTLGCIIVHQGFLHSLFQPLLLGTTSLILLSLDRWLKSSHRSYLGTFMKIETECNFRAIDN